MWEWAPEAQAALTVLGRQEPSIDLRQPLDLRRTDLRRADLIDAQLPEVDLKAPNYGQRTSAVLGYGRQTSLKLTSMEQTLRVLSSKAPALQ